MAQTTPVPITLGPEVSNTFKTITIKALVKGTPMLNEDNYTLWRSKIQGLFKLRGILKAFENDNIQLDPDIDEEMSVYLISKMDHTTHTNVITEENENSSKKIWQAIKNYFASSQSANRARIFFDFLYIKFQEMEINKFITSVRSQLKKLNEFGITLPTNIIVYLLLFKLPEKLKSMRSQIMHSDKDITVDLVINHLIQFKNEHKANHKEEEDSSIISKSEFVGFLVTKRLNTFN